jgi:nucleoside diphosphate kinase
MKNNALVFIKPHANNHKAVSFINNHLNKNQITILNEGVLTAEHIIQNEIIENHYASIAYSAVRKKPAELTLQTESEDKFLNTFGLSWFEAIEKNILFNCEEAKVKLNGISGNELNEIWKKSKQTKVAPGLYAAFFEEEGIYVVNGFYLAMKELYTAPGSEVIWYQTEFSETEVPWKKFRSEVIGATDPSRAVEGSLRKSLLDQWKELDLPYPPNMTENGVHASAGPVEGLKERIIWTAIDISKDPYTIELLNQGFSINQIEQFLENPLIQFEGKKESVFDFTEDVNSSNAATMLKSANK